ncbi:MAG: hypothetical protein WEB09_01105 [Nitriliruptor sp.]
MTVAALPEWIEPTLQRQEGRDPLGLQTTTQDRLMPFLLPDVLELSRRARYISFYAFLLHAFEEQRQKATRERLSRFIKTREYDFGLAVLRCPRECGSSPVGATKLRPAVQAEPKKFSCEESVESANGGYGLYYRTPMIAFDLVAPAGTALGDDALTPIDVLARRDEARELAEAFASAVADTEYIQRYFRTTDPVPLAVVDEYAEVACLCRLDTFGDERERIAASILTAPQPEAAEAVQQRRRSIAHYLTLIDHDANVVYDESAFRQALWTPPAPRSQHHHDIADQWAALAAKDLAQDALCSLWTDFNYAALNAGGLDGLSASDLVEVTRQLCDSEPQLDPDERFVTASTSVDRPDELEDLRWWTVERDTGTSGALALYSMLELLEQRDSPAWRSAATIASAWQPSLLTIANEFTGFLDRDPTVVETLSWLLRRYVISAHERIAYSKLPEFTFRFRMEPTGLRFYDLDSSRFRLAAIRHAPLASLTEDLGYWSWGDNESAELTSSGRELIDEVLA